MATATTAKKAENTFTVFRRQVIQTGSYEPAEASCSVTITVDTDTSTEEIADLITKWGTALEISNYEALGVGYEVADDGTVEMLSKSLPGASASGTVAPAAAPAPAPSGGGGGSLEEIWRLVGPQLVEEDGPGCQLQQEGTGLQAPV